MLIRNYGEYWNPDLINWDQPKIKKVGELYGFAKVNGAQLKINFWNARGIYVLYSDFKPVYVGKAFKTSIGSRIEAHLRDRLAGRWDMFSWFSISSIRKTQKDVSKPAKRLYNPDKINNTLEALAIIIANPRLNRKVEKLEGATFVKQPEKKNLWSVRKYLHEIHKNL